MEIKKHELTKAHLKAMRNKSYKRISRLEAWLDGVKEDREETMLQLEREYARIEMANELLQIIKEMK